VLTRCKNDPQLLNLGLATAKRRAQDRSAWRLLVTTATLMTSSWIMVMMMMIMMMISRLLSNAQLSQIKVLVHRFCIKRLNLAVCIAYVSFVVSAKPTPTMKLIRLYSILRVSTFCRCGCGGGDWQLSTGIATAAVRADDQLLTLPRQHRCGNHVIDWRAVRSHTNSKS